MPSKAEGTQRPLFYVRTDQGQDGEGGWGATGTAIFKEPAVPARIFSLLREHIIQAGDYSQETRPVPTCVGVTLSNTLITPGGRSWQQGLYS